MSNKGTEKMSQNHNAVQKIQHQINTTNDNIHNYVQNKSGGQSVQILILEGHISELKQDPILYVYFYHMLSCTCIAISRAVSQKVSLILMHVIYRFLKYSAK